MHSVEPIAQLPHRPDAILDALSRAQGRRVLLYGEPGSGKSTLAAALAAGLTASGRACHCINADPGSPAFGAPGAVSSGEWREGAWQVQRLEAVCSLDAARFRLPLTLAVQRLARAGFPDTLLIDAPGVVRGVAGAELVLGLAEAAGADALLCLTHYSDAPPLTHELRASGLPWWVIPAHAQARRPGKGRRERLRTAQWDGYLGAAERVDLDLDQLTVIGTPPPRRAEAWRGRQIGLLDAAGRTLAMGEVVSLQGQRARACVPAPTELPARILVRDCRRAPDGQLATAAPAQRGDAAPNPPPDMRHPPGPRNGARAGGPRPLTTLGNATAMMINGVFGDPLLHLRLHHRRRSLLFDLGDSERLPARVAHQVSDVFISHAHIDHIGGFLWLLRSRIGFRDICRVYGPPGLVAHIQGLIAGIRWDRIGDRGPRFELHEVDGDRVRTCRLQVGQPGVEVLGERSLRDNLLREEAEFRIRVATLDHGIPVLAFAFETPQTLRVRKEQLREQGVASGPWLTELKQRVAAGDLQARLDLPDGRRVAVGELAGRFLLSRPGQTLVYATDLADTPGNRSRLIELAAGAHSLFCEAVFRDVDAAQAQRTGHLTARAAGEIAAAAGVGRLLLFHFSPRYLDDPDGLYQEAMTRCSCVVFPPQSVV